MTIEQTRAQLAPVLADLAALTDRIGAGHDAAPTPCTDYDVAHLTGHVVGWLENFTAGFASADGHCPRSDVTDVVLSPAEAGPRIRAAAARLDEALADGGAERPLVISAQGGMPGEIALSMMLGEYIVHGWDLARATDQPWSPADDAVEASHALFAGMVTPEYRGPQGMFDAEVEVPDDAPALERLVAFAGRDPHWRPTA